MSTHNHRLLLQELMCLNESELQLYLDSIHYKIQDKDTRPSFEVLFTLFSYIESKVFRMIKNKKDLNTIVLWGNMANFLMKEVPVLYDRKPYWRDGDFTQSVKFRGKSIRALNHLDSSFLDFNILIDDVVWASKSLNVALFNAKDYTHMTPEERIQIFNNIYRLEFIKNLICKLNFNNETVVSFNNEYSRVSSTNIFHFHKKSSI